MGPRHVRRHNTSRTPIAASALALLAALLVIPAAVGCGGSTPTTRPSQTSATGAATAAEQTTTTKPATTTAAFPVTVTDDTGREVVITHRPERIVSTAPSCTEILFALGAGPRVVGVTTVDDYPPEVKDLPKIGGFAKLSIEAITASDPDLVVAVVRGKEALEPLVSAGKTVVLLNPDSLAGVYRDIKTVGSAVGEPDVAQQTCDRLAGEIETLVGRAKGAQTTPKVFFALDPTLTTAGPGSFLDELLILANADNIAEEGPSEYYQFTPEQLTAADPDVILLSGTMGMKTEQITDDPRFAGLRAVKEGRVMVLDDSTVTRPGPRVSVGLEALIDAIHPEL